MLQYFRNLVKLNMNIPLVDLSMSKTQQTQALKAITNVVSSNNFILSEPVKKFENAFAQYVDSKYCIGVSTGTDALVLSLKSLEVGEGDEVLVPAMTFMATASSVLLAGAKPRFVDISLDLPLLDPEKIESQVTKKTKAIMPVHLHGYPCDMEAITKIAKRHKLFVIEDACQAHGTFYNRKHMGIFGNVAAFSFYPSKNLGAFGDGGAIVTSDKRIADSVHTLRNWGAKEKYIHEVIGHNARLDAIQAVVLEQKLKELDQQNLKRRKHATLYTKLLKNLPIELPKEQSNTQVNYHIYAIKTKKRDELLEYLKNKNIFCGIHYPMPLHLQPALKFLQYKKGDYPNAENFAKETLSLPMYPQLKKEHIIYICEQIKKFYQ